MTDDAEVEKALAEIEETKRKAALVRGQTNPLREALRDARSLVAGDEVHRDKHGALVAGPAPKSNMVPLRRSR